MSADWQSHVYMDAVILSPPFQNCNCIEKKEGAIFLSFPYFTGRNLPSCWKRALGRSSECSDRDFIFLVKTRMLTKVPCGRKAKRQCVSLESLTLITFPLFQVPGQEKKVGKGTKTLESSRRYIIYFLDVHAKDMHAGLTFEAKKGRGTSC